MRLSRSIKRASAATCALLCLGIVISGCAKTGETSGAMAGKMLPPPPMEARLTLPEDTSPYALVWAWYNPVSTDYFVQLYSSRDRAFYALTGGKKIGPAADRLYLVQGRFKSRLAQVRQR